ncbi:MAG: DUF2946 domain-containing protein [Burkholderiaceae bacterium]
MQSIRHLSRRWSWVAFVAIFALAIVPTVSRLLATAQGGSAWAEICTPQGMKPLAQQAGADEPAPGPQASLHGDHCALCGLSATPFAPPPAATPVLAAAPGRVLPPLFGAAPRPLFAWAAAQPRGPPARA